MPVVLSVTFAIGLLLIFLALTATAAAVQPTVRTSWDTWGSRLRASAGGEIGARELLVSSTASGVMLAAVTYLWLGWPVLALAAGLTGTLLPGWYFRTRAKRRRRTVEVAVTEAVEALRDAARVGMSLEEALRMLGRSGPLPLRDTFRAIERDLQFGGLEPALRGARERVADPAFDTFVAALLMSYRVGGRHLADVLDNLARSVRASTRARREAEAAQAQHVLSARVIAALPLVLILAIRATNPEYLAVFASAAGQGVLALCLLSVVAGYAGMLRATQLPVGRRVLR